MKCKLSECGREFRSTKEWAEFCCEPHRQRWHYLQRRAAKAAQELAHVNGDGGEAGLG